MGKNTWLYLFVTALLVHLTGVLFSNEAIQVYTKPLLVIFLLIYFISATKGTKTGLQLWIILALIFSLIGDVLLSLEPDHPDFFLFGLASFLIAHIFYIVFLHRVRVIEKIAARWWLMLIVVIYYVTLITMLVPYLGELKIPVLVYGLVICFMLMLALHSYFQSNKSAGGFLLAGAILFVISDSALALNKFYYPFPYSRFIIMQTYGLAQLFLVCGATEYISSVSKR